MNILLLAEPKSTAAALATDIAERHGATIYRHVDLLSPSNYDQVWLSYSAPRDFLRAAKDLRSHGIEPERRKRNRSPLVVLGGRSAYTPLPMSEIVDVVAIGDGETTIPLILGGVEHDPDHGVWSPWEGVCDVQAAYDPDLEIGHVIPRGQRLVEVARGCRYRCPYCHIGWTGGKLRLAKRETVMQSIRDSARRQILLYAPDSDSVPHMQEYLDECDLYGVRAYGSDSRSGEGRGQIYVGIEGVSERIRREVVKRPRAREWVRKTALKDEVFKLYYIYGFGERGEDWREHYEDMMSFVGRTHLVMTATVLSPIPHTGVEMLSGEYPQEALRFWRFLRESLRHAERPRPELRTLKGEDLHYTELSLARGGVELTPWLLGGPHPEWSDYIEADRSNWAWVHPAPR